MKNFDSACAIVHEPRVSFSAAAPPARPTIFWHRDLPPLDAVAIAEHDIEAASARVHGTLARRDESWVHCYRDLMSRTCERMQQEIDRLGGRYAHVLEESITSHRDDATGEGWLSGRFRYTLLR